MKVFLELNKFNHIQFFDQEHKYVIDGNEMISVTTFIGQYKKAFDRETQSIRIAEKRGLPVEEILAEWDLKRDISCERGSCLHAFAESYLANKIYAYPSERIKAMFGEDPIIDQVKFLTEMFKVFHHDSSKNLVPIKSEFVVGDAELGICGMVDQIYFNKKSGKLEIWDWKTNKSIEKHSAYNRKMMGPVSHLDECELNTYSLQLSLYKYLIEKNTELQFGNSYITWFNEKNESYRVFKCLSLREEVKAMILDYKNQNDVNLEQRVPEK